MSSIEKAETCTEKMHVRRLGMDQASIEANYKTIQDSVSALNEEKVKLNDLIVQYIKGLSLSVGQTGSTDQNRLILTIRGSWFKHKIT